MKQTNKRIFAQIDSNGKLKVYLDEIKEWAKQFKNENVSMLLQVEPTEQSKLTLSYYTKYIVKEFTKAYAEKGTLMTEEEVERTLRENCPYLQRCSYSARKKRYISYTVELHELNSVEFSEYIEYLKRIGAEDFGIYIEEPQTFKTK